MGNKFINKSDIVSMVQRITIKNHLKKMAFIRPSANTVEDYHLEFSGFHPVATCQKHMKGLLHKLHQQAPSSSFLNMQVTKTKDTFYGVVKITSDVADFFVEATGDKLTQMAERLAEGVNRKLRVWRSQRFITVSSTEAVND